MVTKVLVSFLLLFSLDALAQNSTGRIVGVISDPSGAVVGGAKVVVINTATNTRSETVAGADGTYQVLNLPIGNYTVSVEKEGFATVVTQPSELQINQTLRVDVHLAVGAVTQTVGVEAQATQVETEIPTIGGTVTGAAIQDLPLNGRDTLDLALTQPGVIPALNTSSSLISGRHFPNRRRTPGFSQLSPGWRQQHIGDDQRGSFESQPRHDCGVQDFDQQLYGGVWAQCGRRRQRSDEIRHQSIAWQPVRVSSK